VLRLAVPAFVTLVAEPVFLLADSVVVGHVGTVPLAALGVAAAALGALANIVVFLAYGTTGAVARRLGAGDHRGALGIGVDGLWLAAVLGAIAALAMLLLAGDLARWLGADGAVHRAATTYLQISALSLPAMLLNLASTGVLRGLQDTRTPLLSPWSASRPTSSSTSPSCTARAWASPARRWAPRWPSSAWRSP
jgi:Na+-driven multidrug efflux pump